MYELVCDFWVKHPNVYGTLSQGHHHECHLQDGKDLP